MLQEMTQAANCVRVGLASIVPLPIVELMPSSSLEMLVCGMPTISVAALKRMARYRDLEPSHPVVVWLWDILDNRLSEEDKVLFMIFVSGRSRLPAFPTNDLSNQR